MEASTGQETWPAALLHFPLSSWMLVCSATNQKLEIKHDDQSEMRERVASLRVNSLSLWKAALAWELTLIPPGQNTEWGGAWGRYWGKELVFIRTMVSLFTATYVILPTTSGLVVKNTDPGGSFQASSYASRMALGKSPCPSFLICRMVIKEDINDTITECCCEDKVTVHVGSSLWCNPLLLDVGWTLWLASNERIWQNWQAVTSRLG